MRLVLIRHTSVAVPRGICYGRTDVALADSFQEEAMKVRQGLSEYSFERVYSSPLSRCVELARFCGYREPVLDDRLKEIDFGEWEMKAYEEITDPKLQEWFDDYINVAPPGGESVMDQSARFMEFVDQLREGGARGTIGIFTHGGILINALVALGGKSYDEVYAAIPPYGSIVEIDI